MVEPLTIAAGISAASSLFGGLFKSSSQDKANRANLEAAALDRAQQREFAQSGIQWRVEDAKKAGIHPLYAMGAALPTYSPTSFSSSPSTGFSEGLSSAGQNISRAVQATATHKSRSETHEVEQLQLRNMQLQNDLLATQISGLQRSQIGPPFPSSSAGLVMPGQGDTSGRIIDEPQLRTTPHPDQMSSEPGAIVDTGWAKSGEGYAPVPSENVKQRIEDTFGPEFYWMVRNYGPMKKAPPFKAPPGTVWRFSYASGLWLPHKPMQFNKKKSLYRHEPFGAHRSKVRKPAYRGRTFTKGKRRN